MADSSGPAFACAAENGHQPGMTLRQWYAGMALATMSLGSNWSDNPAYWDGVVRSAYAAADAMLRFEERERQS